MHGFCVIRARFLSQSARCFGWSFGHGQEGTQSQAVPSFICMNTSPCLKAAKEWRHENTCSVINTEVVPYSHVRNRVRLTCEWQRRTRRYNSNKRYVTCQILRRRSKDKSALQAPHTFGRVRSQVCLSQCLRGLRKNFRTCSHRR